jgi:glutamine amidotransferase
VSVAIINYGSGNLRSVAKAFERAARESGLDLPVVVTSDPEQLRAADRIVLPGVGAFGDCAAGLSAIAGMRQVLEEVVIGAGRPFLGICVGMQLLAERGLEHGAFAGLGWIAGEVVPIPRTDPALKIPHMGWNVINHAANGNHPLMRRLDGDGHAYFVHSYYFEPAAPGCVLATVDYGIPITAAVGRDNIVGVQFHPEKSQKLGLKLLANFLNWRP